MAVIIGTSGRDILNGSFRPEDDVIFGLGGADDLFGFAGADNLNGGAGADFLKGGTGNDRLFGGEDNDVLISGEVDRSANLSTNNFGGGFDFLDGGSGNDRLIVTFDSGISDLGFTGGDVTIEGGDGVDTLQMGFDEAAIRAYIDLFDITSRSRIDLASGTGTYVYLTDLLDPPNDPNGAIDIHLVISDVENIDGSAFNEDLSGDASANIIKGGRGDDTLEGRGGADTLDGGLGRDRAVYAGSPSSVDIDLTRLSTTIAGQQIGGDAQGDRLSGIEDVSGSQFADVIRGNSSSNELIGNSGNDVLEGREGGDTLNGGSGSDTASYESSNGGVTVRVADAALGLSSSATGGDAKGDTLISIENLIGSAFDDTLTGNSGVNILTGGTGRDVLFGGGSNDTLAGGFGNDTLDGGLGRDTASFATASVGVRVTLGRGSADGEAQHSFLETDILRSIENAIGSDFADTFFGNEQANTFSGGKGNDVFISSFGADTYIGGDGIDTLDYGAETSTFIIVNTLTGTTNLFAALPTGGVTDNFSEIERVVGTNFDDQFTAGRTTDILLGGAGNDIYNVSNTLVTVLESNGRGNDQVLSSVNYALQRGQEIESLATNNAAAITAIQLTGNEFDNTITGNAGANRLTGGEGEDSLQGLGGDDTYEFFGGVNLGFDTFLDASGDDTVEFDFSTIQSISRSGNDLVASLTNGTFTVLDHFNGHTIEQARDATTLNVVTLAAGLTGGDASGIIAGTDQGETLDGRGGDDLLYGNDGNDVLLGGDGDDLLNGGKGKDVLIGGNGADILTGGKGNDTFVFACNSGNDVIQDFGNGHDQIDLTAFDTTFRALDDDRDGRLERGEGDGHITVDISHGDTLLTFAGGSIRVDGVTGLGQHDFLL